MALLPILRFPDARLKKIAAPVEKIDDGIRRLVADMAETMYEAPGIYDKVERAAQVSVEYLDLEGERRTLTADGLLAVCIQHELDHLQGKVFVEHLSQLKQMRIKTKLAKQARITA